MNLINSHIQVTLSEEINNNLDFSNVVIPMNSNINTHIQLSKCRDIKKKGDLVRNGNIFMQFMSAIGDSLRLCIPLMKLRSLSWPFFERDEV